MILGRILGPAGLLLAGLAFMSYVRRQLRRAVSRSINESN
jgi:hypothetical protein